MRRNAGRRGGMGEDLVSVLIPVVNDGRWVMRSSAVSLKNSFRGSDNAGAESSKGQPPVLVCNSVSILCGSRHGKRHC